MSVVVRPLEARVSRPRGARRSRNPGDAAGDPGRLRAARSQSPAGVDGARGFGSRNGDAERAAGRATALSADDRADKTGERGCQRQDDDDKEDDKGRHRHGSRFLGRRPGSRGCDSPPGMPRERPCILGAGQSAARNGESGVNAPKPRLESGTRFANRDDVTTGTCILRRRERRRAVLPAVAPPPAPPLCAGDAPGNGGGHAPPRLSGRWPADYA